MKNQQIRISELVGFDRLINIQQKHRLLIFQFFTVDRSRVHNSLSFPKINLGIVPDLLLLVQGKLQIFSLGGELINHLSFHLYILFFLINFHLQVIYISPQIGIIVCRRIDVLAQFCRSVVCLIVGICHILYLVSVFLAVVFSIVQFFLLLYDPLL